MSRRDDHLSALRQHTRETRRRERWKVLIFVILAPFIALGIVIGWRYAEYLMWEREQAAAKAHRNSGVSSQNPR